MSKNKSDNLWIYKPLGWLLALLGRMPLGVLYILADIIGVFAHRIVRYRIRLVRQNLIDSFPDISDRQLNDYVRKFYRHLADYFVETLRLPYMSEKELRRRMTFENTALVDDMFAKGKNMVIYTSHFGNWEWITSMALWCHTPDAIFAHVYRPLKNKWFDAWFLRMRSKYNTPVAKSHVVRQMLIWRKNGVKAITGFLSDQKPSHAGSVITLDFLGRPTRFIYGTEEIARKFGLPVLCFDTRCVRRGYYHSTIRLIAENPGEVDDGEITRRYAANLETTIRSYPPAYLWSHNRWQLKLKK